MRIALVSEHASPLALLGGADAGGQNVYVAALAQELGRRGHRVVVHTRRQDEHTPRRVRFADNVVVDHVDAGPHAPIPKDDIWPHIDAFAADLRRAWRQDRPEVVHSHFWMSGIAALEAAAPLGLPVLHTYHALGNVKRRHQGAADTSPPDREPAEQRIVAEADRIVATCSDEAFELRQLGAQMSRVSIVPCGVNLDNFGPEGPARSRDPAFAHRIVCVSRLVPRKGIDDVVRALAEVPDTELVVAGGPKVAALDTDPEVGRLRQIAEELGVGERVRFVGALERHQVPPLLRSADVAVTVPWYEPFGIVPLEIMACGVPVVASAVGGMIDTVVDGVTGLHVPPREPDAVAAALRHLLDDGGLRDRLGAAGARRVRRRYTWARVTDGVVDAYQQAITGAAGRRRNGIRLVNS
ncbi:glycosyltransferase [Egicoccus halophilus]|uniref:Glycosyl transferase n=1 Tax=Egicoccus halophilus TaxID=1670830 RepID=A0A8J3A8M6_9ACTN|nr:glycosyltransferase [Egicoccus halophilus]GGI04561.1 glycosyl transferase [Egicoccus halophilus]